MLKSTENGQKWRSAHYTEQDHFTNDTRYRGKLKSKLKISSTAIIGIKNDYLHILTFSFVQINNRREVLKCERENEFGLGSALSDSDPSTSETNFTQRGQRPGQLYSDNCI